MAVAFRFPSPLEVDRFLYPNALVNNLTASKFPSPLEVDRFLYRDRIC